MKRSYRLAVCILFFGLAAFSSVAQTNHLLIINHLLDERRYSRPRPTTNVDFIVLHFSSDCSAHPTDPYNLERVIGTLTNGTASAHYIIDRDGHIYRLIPEQRAAFHAGKGSLPWNTNVSSMNAVSIGIEMLGISTWDDMKMFIPKATYDKIPKEDIGFTDAQYRAVDLLIADIRSRWPDIPYDRKHIIGHSDWTPKRRTDPGVVFDWSRIKLAQTVPKE